MSTNLSVFSFEGQEVRFVGTDEKPEWIAADVCFCLEIAEAKSSLRDFDEDEKGVRAMHTLGGEQQMLTVTEPGLYRLIFKSRKPVARRFQRWVFHEVLPTIRKTGKYELSTQHPALPPHKLALDVSNAIAQIKDKFSDSDPRLCQYLVDYALNSIANPNQKALPGNDKVSFRFYRPVLCK